jgi:phosphate transport system permease protein
MGRRWRTWKDRIFWGLGGLALALIAAPAIWILISIFHQAAPAFGWSLFTQTTHGIGVQNAIYGTLLLLLGVLIVAGGIGVAAGIYLAEFAGGRTQRSLRFFSEVLSGTPSIVVGYVGYLALVIQFHWGFSLAAAILALSILVLPYVVKTTEVAVRQVPTALREASAGLGISRSRTVISVLVPPALPGIVSGLVIALAISTGETAPLLFTAGFSDANPSLSLFHHPLGYLTGVTFNDLALPGQRAHSTAAAAGAVTLIMLLILIGVGQLISRRSRRSIERMSL